MNTENVRRRLQIDTKLKFCLSFLLSLFFSTFVVTFFGLGFLYWYQADWTILIMGFGSLILYFIAALLFFPITLMAYLPIFLTRFHNKHYTSTVIAAFMSLLCYFVYQYESSYEQQISSELAQFYRTFSGFTFIGVLTGIAHPILLKRWVIQEKEDT